MKILTPLVAVAVGLTVAAAAPALNKAGEPVKLTKVQLDKIVAGNGSHPGSSGPNGPSGNNGNSAPPPGQISSPPPNGQVGG